MSSKPERVGQIVLSQTDSTNDEARRRLGLGQIPTWVLAEEQMKGRGRRGRNWISPKGNFYASLVYEPQAPIAEFAQRSFIAALSLWDALVAEGDVPGLSMKWPNDVLLDGRKLAGILLETEGRALIVGIGINLANAPKPEELDAGALASVTLLEATGAVIGPESLLDHLASIYAGWEAVLSQQGFAPVRDAWLARASGIGEKVTARLADRSETGIFDGIDANGALLLRQESGTLTLPAADIHFG